MDISGSHRIAAPREAVWAALNDPETLRACIPGCERLTSAGDGAYEGTVATKVGPIRTTIAGEASVSGAAAPERFSLAAKGADPTAGGGEGSGEVTLEDDGGGTLVSYSGQVEAHGKISQLGSRLLTGVFRKTVETFFERLAERLGAPAEIAAPGLEPDAPAALPEAPPLVHEEPAETEAPVLDAPPLDGGTPVPPLEPTPIAPTATPVVPEPEAIVAADAVETEAGGASVTTRIMLVALIVVVIGALVYYMVWQAPPS